MNLLSDDQITELVMIASNQSTSKDLYGELCEWNEKQVIFGEQFEPDWNTAPESAFIAVVNMSWVNKDKQILFRSRIATYKRPAPVITQHQHAALMMKYAEAAARRVDPWVEFEIKDGGGDWEKLKGEIGFYPFYQIRYVGEQQ